MQKPVEPKKILCIHDLSGVGRCSLAVILPVLSVMGFQPVALPTVVLSTHTGGLGTPARMDGSAYGMAALEHYQTLGLQFDCIYTGYLGGEAQVALAEKAFALWPAAYKVVDPVMGDNGKAYSTVTPALVERIRSLCRAADLILPNYTEAQLLLQQQPVARDLRTISSALKMISDMERIKDNFENRCVQICCNIKTELDRLPKLSSITMDNEVISIIGLSVPYAKESDYKERMAAYIDETVLMAESFDNTQERLKYIRNRLSWKRLFAVIVTDMNAIRVSLYKRERMKDQSRYLRYEEAVGSTGQSQGIYIQFLIAVIHYISSINAPADSAGVLGKTIFIDNPFGAAKDIYIWEPIFKLLKTNHVQLIVPARGATPAITGRFDVNYILGQKLVDGRQQTVVVDYYSRTNTTQLEYTRMDYEQTSFEFFV